MQLSIFEVLGPVMIGPSSSHTAGAAKLAKVAAMIAHKPFKKISFGLSGSFAKTGQGHGTDKALLAGALGFAPDDERIRDIESIAKKANVIADYHHEEIEDMHENSVHIRFFHDDGTCSDIWGASVGGGRISIRRIGKLDVEISAESPTLIIPHKDRPGVVSDVSRTLATNGMNIAIMRLSREARGQGATLIIELDSSVPAQIVSELEAIEHVNEVIVVDVPQF